MRRSTVSTNIQESKLQGIDKVNFTSSLDINEPSLNKPVPIFKILNDNGDILNNSKSIIVSKI